ncbi:unnamed protein product [Meloidogyne enterolobii]|uniref:Uncharacterized protein n=1 Tax=Meloidogyne enterolobii TaxID=390850 RepID=A0ACB0YK45_MELEN
MFRLKALWREEKRLDCIKVSIFIKFKKIVIFGDKILDFDPRKCDFLDVQKSILSSIAFHL